MRGWISSKYLKTRLLNFDKNWSNGEVLLQNANVDILSKFCPEMNVKIELIRFQSS